MAVSSDITDVTEDDLDLPQETREHILSCEVDASDHTVIVYQQKPDLGRGEVTLATHDDGYRVSHTYDPFAGEREEGRKSFDTLSEAVCQMAAWLDVDVEELLNTRTVTDAAAIDVSVDDLDCPRETANHTFTVLHLLADKPVIVYSPKNGDGDSDDGGDGDDARVELITVDGTYQVTVARDVDGERVQEREVFDTLGAAVEQLATWMGVDIEVFLDGGDVDG